MTPRNKAILINSSILVGLLFEYWIGKPLFAIVITGTLLLVVANLAMVISARKQASTKN
jgi:hypothetical protein